MINRGEVWWASLPDPRGSEPGFRRPVLVISADPFNRSRLSTVTVVAITSNQELAGAPGNVQLSRSASGLSQDSVANVSQVLTIDRAFLGDRAGALTPAVLAEVDSGLRLALAL